jgi:23S rRNA (uracil1939-C5)-methyltransferase
MHLDRGPRRGDVFDIKIEEMTVQGLGEATLEARVGPQQDHIIYQVFVRKAVPGDVLRVRVEQSRRKRITAQIIEVLQPSKMRIEPKCRHFGLRTDTDKGCGGCTLQSLTYRPPTRRQRTHHQASDDGSGHRSRSGISTHRNGCPMVLSQ